MKKVISVLLVVAAVAMMAVGCGGAKKAPLTDDLSTIIDKIYEQKDTDLNPSTMPVDINDLDYALKAFTGLDSNELISDAVVSESMIGSIPYSMVLVRVKDAADAKTVAEQMKSGIDQRKWICVEADDMQVAGYADVVMLVMVGSEFAEDGLTSQAIVDAFAAVCPAELDFTI